MFGMKYKKKENALESAYSILLIKKEKSDLRFIT